MQMTNKTISDTDVKLLAAIASTLEADYIDAEDPWAGSPFAWIKTRPSRQIGKIGEQLVAGWCAAKGLAVGAATGSDADRLINGKRMEIKFSTEWKAGGYKFQQIRDQDYQFVVCLGLRPFDAHCWVIPKREAWNNGQGQHGGRNATDTKWISISPDDPPAWIVPWGGTLGRAFKVLTQIK